MGPKTSGRLTKTLPLLVPSCSCSLLELSPQPTAGQQDSRTDRHGLQGASLPPPPPGPQGLRNDNHSKLLDEAEALTRNVDAPATAGLEREAVLGEFSQATEMLRPASGFPSTSSSPGWEAAQ